MGTGQSSETVLTSDWVTNSVGELAFSIKSKRLILMRLWTKVDPRLKGYQLYIDTEKYEGPALEVRASMKSGGGRVSTK